MKNASTVGSRLDESVTIHPTADVDPDAAVGARTSIWNWTKVREGATVGQDCSIGQHGYVDTNVVIGDRCKIQNAVNMYDGLSIGSDVFIGPAVTFTNDLHPRALGDWEITRTLIEDGASIGANATIVCGVTLGTGCMVGAGAVVIHDVAPGVLVVGNPARPVGDAAKPQRRSVDGEQ